jgi:hypothetical protein
MPCTNIALLRGPLERTAIRGGDEDGMQEIVGVWRKEKEGAR